MFWFSSLPSCLLWVAVISSDNRSTRLLPKQFWVVEMHHTAKIIWLWRSRELVHRYHDQVLKPSFKPLSQDGFRARKLLMLHLLTQKVMYNLWKHENMTQKVVQLGNWAAMVKVRVFLLGILFISNHRNCSDKALFKRLLSHSNSKWGLTHWSEQLEVCITYPCLDHGQHLWPPGHTVGGIRIFREVWAQAAFFWLKRGSFQICSEGSPCRYKCNKD